MLIATVKITLAEANRQEAIDALQTEAPVIRAMAGCLTFNLLVDPANSETLLIFHEWEHADNFADYLSSASFANANSFLGPLCTAPPISRRFDAQLIQ